MQNQLTYEQPLNETIRVCLRLEQLFHQIDYQLKDLSLLGTRHLIHLLVNLLLLLDRPDLKSKLAKELTHHLINLERYKSFIDDNGMKILKEQLNHYSRHLIDSSGKIGYRLRDIELLNMLRLHLASPGGGCSFDLPIYHFWLHQPETTRRDTIIDWLSEFTEIRNIIQLLLNLIRDHARVEEKVAQNGFHQELLDPQTNLRLLRVSLEAHYPTYPEISIGRHFLSIRFFTPDIHRRPPAQYQDNIPFLLSFCND